MAEYNTKINPGRFLPRSHAIFIIVEPSASDACLTLFTLGNSVSTCNTEYALHPLQQFVVQLPHTGQLHTACLSTVGGEEDGPASHLAG